MHERWQEMIPFYAAGSLSAAEAADLERHLGTCSACRQTLDEWRIIGRVVRAEGEKWSREIPRLSPAARAALQAAPLPSADGEQTWPEETRPVFYPRAAVRRYPAQRRTWGVLTLAAAFVTLILVGGLALYMAGRPETAGDEDATPVALLASVTQTQGVEPIFSDDDSEQYGAPGSLDQDMGILPVGTPSPGTSTTGGQAQLPATATHSAPGSTLTSDGQDVLTEGRCEAGSSTGREVAIHSGPGRDYEITGAMFPAEYLEVWQKNGAGWFMVVGQDGYIAGWVSEGQVTLYGPCESVPLPSPTSSPLPPGCYVTSTIHDSVNMRAGPGEEFEAINAFGRHDTAEVLARSDNHWYRVALPLYGNVWVGWVVESQVVLSGQCDALPVLSADGYTPESTPMLATPTAVFGSIMGTGGYNLMTTQAIGSIPANTRVMVSYARYTGQEWVYFVVTQDGQIGVEVYDWQLTYAPDMTPNAPTPVARFSSEIGMSQYNVVTTAPVGNIPANTRVRVGTARFDGREWVYNVVAQDTQLAADALESQLAYAPDATPGAPTPTATPSS